MVRALAAAYPVAQVIPWAVYDVVDALLEDRHLSLNQRERKLEQHAPVLLEFLKPRLNAGNLDEQVKALLRAAKEVAMKAFIPVSADEYRRANRRVPKYIPPLRAPEERPPEEWSKIETMLRTGTCSLLRKPEEQEWQKTELGGSHVHRSLRRYVADTNGQAGDAQGSCTKHKTPGGVYVPGCIFFWCAKCSRCVYFGVMKNAESPRTVFEAIYTHWETPPELVVYDNACNFNNFCLNREPEFFKNTRVLVDATHYAGHKKCNPGYNSKRYRDIKNSSLAEQKNRFLRLLETQALCMGQINFMRFVRHFVYRLNKREGEIERGECFYIKKKPRITSGNA